MQINYLEKSNGQNISATLSEITSRSTLTTAVAIQHVFAMKSPSFLALSLSTPINSATPGIILEAGLRSTFTTLPIPNNIANEFLVKNFVV